MAGADGPPASEQSRAVVTLVDKAAALVARSGKAAFAEFRKRNSEWFRGDRYIFVYDHKGNVLLNPAFPEREGTNVSGQPDANGKRFHDEIMRMAESAGAGWVDYLFPKPGDTTLSPKWTYVRKVVIDDVPGLVASGFYPV